MHVELCWLTSAESSLCNTTALDWEVMNSPVQLPACTNMHAVFAREYKHLLLSEGVMCNVLSCTAAAGAGAAAAASHGLLHSPVP